LYRLIDGLFLEMGKRKYATRESYADETHEQTS